MNYPKILIISVLISILLIILDQPLEGDASQYDILGWNLKNGNGFSLSQNSPFMPSMAREPIYPIFLSMIFLLFGHKYLPVQLSQVFIFILISIFVRLLSKKIFDSNIAKYSMIATAFCPTLISYPGFLYSEAFATLIILLAIFSLIMVIKRPTLFQSCIAGVILAIAALCKAMMLPFFVLTVLCFFFIKFDTWKKKILSQLLFTLCFGIIIFPWLLHNYHFFNKPTIALRGGKVLWMRAQKIDYSTQQIYKHTVFTFSESLGDMIYPDKDRKNTSDVYLLDSLKSDQYLMELEKRGYNPVEIDDIFFHEAIDKIKLHPLKYLLQTPLEFIKMLSFIYLPTLNQSYIINRIRYSNIFLKTFILVIRALMRFSSYLIIALVFIGMYMKRREWQNWYFLFLIIIYINLIHSLLFGDGRYAVVLIPFYLIFASIPVDYIIKRFKPYNNL